MKRLIIRVAILLLLVLSTSPANAEISTAAGRYEEMLLRSPRLGTAWDRLIQEYATGQGLEALSTRWKEKAGSPANPYPYMMLSGLLAQQRGREDEAKEWFRKASATNPSDPAPLRLLAGLQIQTGEAEKGVETIRRALKLSLSDEQKADLLKTLARTHQREMNTEQAVAAWMELAQTFPDDPFTLEEASEALMDLGSFDKAQSLLEQMLTQAKGDPFREVDARLRMARLLEHSGKSKETIETLEALLPLTAPGSWQNREVRSLIERVFRKKHDLPSLARYYRDKISSGSKDVAMALSLARVLEELGQTSDMLKVLNEAESWAPQDASIQLRKALVFEQMGAIQKALDIYNKLSRLHPGDTDLHIRRGDLHWSLYKSAGNQQHRDLALRAWRSIADPNNPNTLVKLAGHLKARGLQEEALEVYEELLEKTPGASDVRTSAAVLAHELGKSENAYRLLEGLIHPEAPTADQSMELYRALKRIHAEDARLIQALDKGLELAPDHFELLLAAWRHAISTDHGERAKKLFPNLVRNAPTMHYIREIEDRYIQLLSQDEQLDAAYLRLAATCKSDGKADDWRLLARIDLFRGDQESALGSLGKALQQHPTEVSLLLLKARYEEKYGTPESHIQALEKVIQTEPKLRSETLKQIANVAKRSDQFQKALDAAQRLIALQPARADGYILASSILESTEDLKGAIQMLKEGIALSENPNEIRPRLAELHLRHGDTASARSVLNRAFEEEKDEEARFRIFRRLAEVYFQEGKTDELIRRFRNMQKAEADGSYYAPYLAEIFLQLEDYASAREELEKAIGSSASVEKLEQLLRVAKAEGNSLEEIAILRRLTSLDPSPGHFLKLAGRYLELGNLEEAKELIHAHTDELANDPSRWLDLLESFAQEAPKEDFTELLQKSILPRIQDPGRLLTLAEFIMQDNPEEAVRLLWRIFQETTGKEPSAPASGSAAPWAHTDGWLKPFWQASATAQSARFRTEQLTSGHTSPSSFGRSISISTKGGSFSQTSDPFTMRITSLVHLAALSIALNQEEDFLKRLKESMDQASTPRHERLLNFLLIEDVGDSLKLAREILNDPDKTDQEVMTLLYAYHQLLQLNLIPEKESDFVIGQILPLLDHVEKSTSGKMLHACIFFGDMLKSRGLPEQGMSLFNRAIAAVNPSVLPEVATGIQLALRTELTDKAVELYTQALSRLDMEQQPHTREIMDQMAMAIASTLLSQKKPEGLQWAMRYLQAICQKQATQPDGLKLNHLPSLMASGGILPHFHSRASYHQYLNSVFPGPSLYISPNAIRKIAMMFEAAKKAGMNREMEERIASLSPQQGDDPLPEPYPFLLKVYWLLWNDQKDEAITLIRERITTHPDEGHLLLLSSVLAENGNPREAIKKFDAFVEKNRPDPNAIYDLFLLNLCVMAEESEKALETVQRLKTPTLSVQDAHFLAQKLDQLGLRTEAEALRKQPSLKGMANPSGQPPSPLSKLVQLVDQYQKENNKPEAERFARKILSQNPLNDYTRQSSSARSRALQVLHEIDRLDAYIQDLKDQLANSDRSVRLHYSLAEAYFWKKDPDCILHLESMVELKPRDFPLHYDIAQKLMSMSEFEKAASLYEALLRKNPVETVRQHFPSVQRAFEKTDSFPALTSILLSLEEKPAHAGMNQSWLAHTLLNFGSRLNQLDKPGLALSLWQKALESSSPGDPIHIEILNLLCSTLVKQGKHQQAAQAIMDHLFPEQDKSTLIFSSTRGNASPGSRQYLFQSNFSGNELEDSAGLSLLKLTQKTGHLDKLIQKMETTTPLDQEKGLHEDLILLARALSRDRAVLPLLHKRIVGDEVSPDEHETPSQIPNPSLQINPHELHYHVNLAKALEGWPEATSVRLQALRLALDLSKPMSATQIESFIRENLITLASETGDQDLVLSLLKESLESIEHGQANNHYINPDDILSLAKKYLSLSMTEETRKCTALIRKTELERLTTSQKRILGIIQTELDIISGKSQTIEPIVWAMPLEPEDSGTPVSSPARIFWKLAVPMPASHKSAIADIELTDHTFKSLDGKFDLKLLYGRTPFLMQELAEWEKILSKGDHNMQLPQGFGYIQGALTLDQETVYGPIIPIAIGKNLLTNPQGIPSSGGSPKGWKQTPVGDWKYGQPSPFQEPEATFFDKNDHQRIEATATPLPINPKQDYIITGWQTSNASLGWELLDEKGHSVNRAPSSNRTNHWIRVLHRLSSASYRPSETLHINKSATHLAPRISFYKEGGFYGFQAIEIPRAENPEPIIQKGQKATRENHPAEALGFFRTALAIAPEKTINNYGSPLLEAFESSHQLPELAALITAPHLHPSKDQYWKAPVKLSHSWIESLARKLANSGDEATATGVWLAGFRLIDPRLLDQYSKAAADHLLAIGKSELALPYLFKSFWDDVDPSKDSSVQNLWSSDSHSHSRYEILLCIQKAGATEKLLQHLEELEVSPKYKAPVLFTQCLVAALNEKLPFSTEPFEELLEQLGSSRANRSISGDALMLLTRHLASHSETRPLAKKIIDLITAELNSSSSPHAQLDGNLELAQFCQQADWKEQSHKHLEIAIEAISRFTPKNYSLNSLKKITEFTLSLNSAPLTQKLLEKLNLLNEKADSGNSSIQKLLDKVADKQKFISGDLSHSQPHLFYQEGKLLWQLSSSRQDSFTTIFRNHSPEITLPSSYQLEILSGTFPEKMEPVKSITTDKISGHWEFTPPESFSFLQARIRKDELTVNGPIIPVCTTKNLLPSDYWDAQASRKDSSEFANHYFTTEDNRSTKLTVSPVNIDPNRCYILSGWLRANSRYTTRIKYQFSSARYEREIRSKVKSDEWIWLYAVLGSNLPVHSIPDHSENITLKLEGRKLEWHNVKLQEIPPSPWLSLVDFAKKRHQDTEEWPSLIAESLRQHPGTVLPLSHSAILRNIWNHSQSKGKIIEAILELPTDREIPPYHDKYRSSMCSLLSSLTRDLTHKSCFDDAIRLSKKHFEMGPKHQLSAIHTHLTALIKRKEDASNFDQLANLLKESQGLDPNPKKEKSRVIPPEEIPNILEAILSSNLRSSQNISLLVEVLKICDAEEILPVLLEKAKALPEERLEDTSTHFLVYMLKAWLNEPSLAQDWSLLKPKLEKPLRIPKAYLTLAEILSRHGSDHPSLILDLIPLIQPKSRSTSHRLAYLPPILSVLRSVEIEEKYLEIEEIILDTYQQIFEKKNPVLFHNYHEALKKLIEQKHYATARKALHLLEKAAALHLLTGSKEIDSRLSEIKAELNKLDPQPVIESEPARPLPAQTSPQPVENTAPPVPSPANEGPEN